MANGVFCPVEIPHDWMIYDVHDLYRTGEGWYRRIFTYAPSDARTILRFEGVYMDSTVFVNGEAAFEWKYGYTTFEADITDHLTPGENTIAVRAVYRDPNTRWYSGAGIYRRVWLITAPATRILSDGVYISAKKSGDGWHITVRTDTNARNGRLVHKVFDRDGNVVSTLTAAVGVNGNEVSAPIKSPRLWDPDDTYLYRIETELFTDDILTDRAENTFGFRDINFDQNEGFFINGRHLKLHGVCEHHDLGALGAAVNAAALRRKLKKLASMGVNSIRTSHNPPAVELLELCDEMGFLVVDESFDMWEHHKTEYDYASYFPEWHERDVASWIRRDRNHPCIIMWSIGNEIGDTTTPRGIEVTEMLCRIVRIHDPYKNAFITSGSNHMRSETAQKCGELLDVVGYNYAESLYDAHHKRYPSFCIYGSETASTVQSRGIYHLPYSAKYMTHDDRQCSSLFNCTTSWGSKSTEYNITEDRRASFCAGQYIWTGFDYIGEPTPYDTKNSYFGQIDTAGFPKDSYYAYRAEWTDGNVSPMVHITPSHWDFNEGEIIDVTVHSNAARAELYFNDEFVGAFNYDHEHGTKISEFCQLPYIPGELKAIAYDSNGHEVAHDAVRSFSDPVRILIEPETDTLKADGRDLIFVDISTIDENGVHVANARNRMNVTVTGAGRLVGLDNGDSTDYEQYKCSSRRLFSGRLLAIVAATKDPGDIYITVTSPGLPSEAITLTALPAAVPDGTDIIDACTPSPESDEVPPRQIKLHSHGVNTLNGDSPTVHVEAELCPANTTFREIEWSAVSRGVTADFVRIEANDAGATVTATADGEFTLRAASRIGTRYPAVVSELRLTASGIGEPHHDPYHTVAGILADSTGDSVPDEEGGIRFTGIPSNASYKRIDFGSVGSCEFSLRLMRCPRETLTFRLFDVTGNAERMLGEFTFHADQPWYIYSENTFRLVNTLTGIHDLRFDFPQPLVFGSFRFIARERAYEALRAVDCDMLYGDAYVRETEAVTHIGNNVTVGFTALDFGSGARTVTVCGKTRHDRDTVEIRIGSEVMAVEFERSDEPYEVTVPVNGAVGVSDVNIIFLPGCDFDLYSVRFER